MTPRIPQSGRRIGFKRHLRTTFSGDGTTYLIAEGGVTALTGTCAGPIARLLDGSRDLAGVVRDAPDALSAQEVAAGLRRLTESGLLTVHTDHDEAAEPAALAYWDAAGVHGSEVFRELCTGQVAITSVSGLDTAPVEEALNAVSLSVTGAQGPPPGTGSGTQVATGTRTGTEVGTGTGGTAPTAGDTGLTIVLCDDYLDPRIAPIDLGHRRAGRPWLIAKPTGTEIWIGPVFTPGDGPCWQCLADRVAVHRRAESHLQALTGAGAPLRPPPVALPVVTAAAAHTIALEAAKWIGGYRYAGQRRIWTQDSLTLSTRHHDVSRRPQCPSCGEPELMRRQAERPVEPVSCRKTSCASGGHRSAEPEQTFERYRHLIDPVTGIIDDIAPDDRGPSFFNSYRSGPNLALTSRTLDGLRTALRSHSGGKGVTAADAKAGALCEAIERFSGSFQGDEWRITGSYDSLRDTAIHPNDCQLYDARQYATRREWNRDHGPMLHVPPPFDDQAVVDWTPVWSLSGKGHRLLPTSMLYFGAPGPVPADSNGNAAGSSREDAILQGLLELVERDAVALWWYNRARLPGFDLDDLGDPWIDRMREVHAGLDRDVWVLDVTSDLRVPVMAAVSRHRSGDERIMFGFGAHLDPAVAVRRALTELNQAMPWVVAEPEGPPRESGDPDLDRWLHEITVASQPYLAPDPAARRRCRADHSYTFRPDLADDVQALQTMLESAGLEVLVLDQTRPDVRLPVVKVIVPGLRPFWARYAPGRLFDVPVLLGRQPRPTAYEELNPVPLFA